MIVKEHTRNQKRMYRIHKQEEKIHDLELLVGTLQQENQKLKIQISAREEVANKYKEVIDKIMNLIKQYGKYDGKKCTHGFQMWSADFNKILDMLKEVSE